MTAVRKAYQKAVLAPVHLVEQIWKEYENFENSVSRALVGCLPFVQCEMSRSYVVTNCDLKMGFNKIDFAHRIIICWFCCSLLNMGYCAFVLSTVLCLWFTKK
jgi:hypothetical protein